MTWGRALQTRLQARVLDMLVTVDDKADGPGHAHHDEGVFLPRSRQTLGRTSNHMAAPGVWLQRRHVVPDLLKAHGLRG